MSSELATFIRMGFNHIADVGALDHILFLLALAAIYRGRDWRGCLAVVTAFTVGHSLTLALAVTGLVTLPERLIEFMIPLTIVITGAENIVVLDRGNAPLRGYYRPIFAGIFGLVHGAGFANYLRGLFPQSIALPLFGFNLGIELGQIVVLACCGVVLAGLDVAIARVRAPQATPTAFRLRTLAVSIVVLMVAARMALLRVPW